MKGTIISWERTPITIIMCVLCIIPTILLLATDMGAKVYNALCISQYTTGLTEIQNGQVWRLITPIFMHGSWSHLFFNLVNLIIFGARIELIEGPRKYLSIILISALICNLAQWSVSGPNFLGISGVVFALVGFLGVRQWRFPDYPIRIPVAFYSFVGLYLLAGVTGVLDTIAGGAKVANTSHIVGIIVGGLMGLKR